jgi:hypothetical protein
LLLAEFGATSFVGKCIIYDCARGKAFFQQCSEEGATRAERRSSPERRRLSHGVVGSSGSIRWLAIAASGAASCSYADSARA